MISTSVITFLGKVNKAMGYKDGNVANNEASRKTDVMVEVIAT